MLRSTRAARLATAVLAASMVLTLAATGAKAGEEEEEAEHRAEMSTRDLNATTVSAVWTLVPIVAGLAIGANNDGGGTTLASGTLVWGGAVLGPAAGYWYGGAGKRAVPGLVIRGATLALVSALAPTDDVESGTYPAFHDDDDDGKKTAWIVASAVILASGIYDIVRAEGAVKEAERSPLEVNPVFQIEDGRVGVVVSKRF